MDLLDAELEKRGVSWERLSFDARAATKHLDPVRAAHGQAFWVLGYVAAVVRDLGGTVVNDPAI